MSKEPAILALLREALERETPGAAASILFEALGAFGARPPASFAEVVDFVHGPLGACVRARFGDERAARAVKALDRALRLAEMPTGQLATVARFDEETTKSFMRTGRALVVAVVSAHATLAERLDAVLDGTRAVVTHVGGPRRPVRADIALIDASDPTPFDPHALAGVPLVLLWSSNTPGASAMVAALEGARLPLMTFARSEVEALIDVLRARIEHADAPPSRR
ncbi:MAG TPA: hypothetical protein VIL20_15325 [Sandaracinaceae bacterium]